MATQLDELRQKEEEEKAQNRDLENLVKDLQSITDPNFPRTGVDCRYWVAIQLAKIWLEFWLEKRLEIPF